VKIGVAKSYKRAYKGFNATGTAHQIGNVKMYMLEVRKNGEMVDYDGRRFANRTEAGVARTYAVLNVVGPFVDMRVRRA